MTARLAIDNSSADIVRERTGWMAALDAEPLRSAIIHVGAGRQVFSEGEEAELFYKVVSGVVRVCKFLADGRRQIEAFHAAGDVFGLEMGDTHLMSAEAVSDCVLRSYRCHSVEMLAQRDQAVSSQLFQFAIHSLAQAQSHALLLGRRGAPEKLAAFLLAQREKSPSRRVIHLTMTRQDIADYLGLTIETVSRSLSQFARDGLIALPNIREVRLTNVEALEDIAA